MKYAKQILTLALLAACTACTGDFEEYNRNPNKLTDGSIAPSSMMEPLVYDAAKSMASYMLSIANEISQVTVAKSTPRREHCYNLADGNFANIWNLCYKWAANADHMRGLAIDQKQPNYEAIALTMKVYYLSICCDMFGSIAYTEALKGSEGIRQPHIDSQKEAYEAMIADLEQANSLYQPSVVLANATKDGIYGGDIAKWKKFTNTLRLRLLMRVSGRNNAFTPSVGDQIKQLLADPATYPVFESNDDEATVKFTAAAEYYLSYFNTSSFTSETDLSGDHHVSERFLSLIYNQADGTTDPRLRIWIKPRYNASQIQPMVGAISGCTNGYNSRPIADQEPFLHYETLVSDTNPIYLMGYDELLFIKAEAALKGWIAGSAQEYYEEAVQASCEKWGQYGQRAAFPVLSGSSVSTTPVSIVQKDITTLLESDLAKWDGTEQRLAEQKWLSLFWVVGFQMYHEMRRTGYPECKTGLGTIELDRTDGKFIARYPYPLIAVANNRANYEAAFAEQGGSVNDNTMIFPVWWSGQAVARDAGSPWPHSFRHNVIAEEN
ncbi:SusD/RagB family nutrient-binding outer membrane lipoprotein [Alistipes sp.]|uniref:SusD/RagB family nutrient-binding outer membrane lipoprotein n=1 Tax=Alistipes sp. TaxID=1872444 RepID=UPI003AB6186D